MADDKMPPIADLIAQTPGAQPLDKALVSVEARRTRLLKPNGKDGDPSASAAPPEPDDWADTYADPSAAKSILDAIKPNPPPRSKPRLVVDNDTPDNMPEKP